MTDHDSQPDQDKPVEGWQADRIAADAAAAARLTDPTYGGGYHPPRVVDVGELEDRVNALERRLDRADEPCETAEGPAPTPADPADYGTDADARHHQERAERLQRSRDEWRVMALERGQQLADRETELGDVRETLERARAELDLPRLGCATTRQLIVELDARAHVSETIGEKWTTYRTVDR